MGFATPVLAALKLGNPAPDLAEVRAALTRIVGSGHRASQVIGRIRAMLSISLDDIRQGHEDFITGNTFSIEEVRRELRLGTH